MSQTLHCAQDAPGQRISWPQYPPCWERKPQVKSNMWFGCPLESSGKLFELVIAELFSKPMASEAMQNQDSSQYLQNFWLMRCAAELEVYEFQGQLSPKAKETQVLLPGSSTTRQWKVINFHRCYCLHQFRVKPGALLNVWRSLQEEDT